MILSIFSKHFGFLHEFHFNAHIFLFCNYQQILENMHGKFYFVKRETAGL